MALEQRVKVWLETVPVVLKKLGIKHVSLCCHSAGTVYLLNTLLQQRDILNPSAPFVALMGRYTSPCRVR